MWLLLTRGRQRVAALGLMLVRGFAAGLMALYGFAHLADEVMEQETQHVDELVLHTVRQVSSPPLDAIAYFLSFVGAELVAVLLVTLLVAFARRGRWGAAVGLLVTTLGAQLLNDVLKDLFQRTRPASVDWLIPAQAWSFPSGHAMVSAAFYLFIAYLGWRVLRGRPRLVCTVGLLLLILGIGLSRLYLGVHYLTDVVAGYAAGFLWTDAVIIGGHLLGRRRKPVAPAAFGDTARASSSANASEEPAAGRTRQVASETRVVSLVVEPDALGAALQPPTTTASPTTASLNGQATPRTR